MNSFERRVKETLLLLDEYFLNCYILKGSINFNKRMQQQKFKINTLHMEKKLNSQTFKCMKVLMHILM